MHSMWREISFPDTIVENSVGRKNQINASEIQPSGKYPVIDQGQDFIAGYCDDETKLVKSGLPFVIFGDHTRCFKFIDFPFILGADGTKVLKPNPDLFDSKFYYFALLGLSIQNRGYNRHFTLLKEKTVPRPEFAEQRRIAHVLSTVQTAIEQQARLIALTRELKAALMRKLFTEGLRGEKQKETEIGLVPESWTVTEVGKVCKSIVPGRNKPKEFSGDIPWVTTPDIKGKTYITSNITENLVSREHLKEIGGKTVPRDSVIMTCVGEFGIVAIAQTEIVINQQLHAFVCPEFLESFFLCTTLRLRKGYMEQIAHITTLPYLNKSKCESVLISIPEMEEQLKISEMIKTVEKKIELHVQKKHTLEKLFRTLLHQLMTGQTRVNEIDLPGLS